MSSPILMDRRRFLAAAGGLVAVPGLVGDTIGHPDSAIPNWHTVQALLDRYVARGRYAGVAAALSYGGAPPAFPAVGTLAFDSVLRVTRDSIFRIYSCTKPVTGIASMLLVEDGRIELDQPVAEVLPELKVMRVAIDPVKGLDSRPATRPMTMRQLITHSSGLSSWQPFLGDVPISRAYRARGLTPGSFVTQPGMSGYGPQVRGLAAMIARLPEVPLIAEPGTAWNYSMGLDVMGAVIERATGVGLDVFMRERLFDPLGMHSTGFQVAVRDSVRLTQSARNVSHQRAQRQSRRAGLIHCARGSDRI